MYLRAVFRAVFHREREHNPVNDFSPSRLLALAWRCQRSKVTPQNLPPGQSRHKTLYTPLRHWVINVRASYFDETREQVDRLLKTCITARLQ